ncbi:MAG TPA: glycosyltransferase [Rhizomicrobium sp.]|nr:glycosyltransferase [Rhizomicrobium sp.]
MSRIRIAHLYRRFRPDFTGDGIFYERLIPLMAQLGTDHTVVVFETPTPPQTAADFPVHYLTGGSGERQDFSLARWLWENAANFDILHIHSHVDRTFLSYWLARFLGLKVVYSSTLEDSADEMLSRYRPSFRLLAQRLLRGIDHFVGISPRLYSGKSRWVGEDKATVIPQGVTLPALCGTQDKERLRRELGIPPNETVILYVGSISARKGVLPLVKSFAELASGNPNLRLMMVGPAIEPEYGDEVFKYIDKKALRGRITHIPYTDDPGRYYLAADLFAFASYSEGFGNVLLEAMSFGLPVVSRYIDDVTDTFIEHGVSGYLFTRDGDFVSCLKALIASPALRQEMGSRARKRVEEGFQLPDLAKRYVSLYESLTSFASPSGATHDPTLMTGCSTLAPGPARAGMRLIDQSAPKPTLIAVIDTESEFLWSAGVGADEGSVHSIEQLDRAQTIFERHGLRPCYVVDFPVVSNPESAATIKGFIGRGAEVGVHLQPWTTPPLVEPKDSWHAFPGNLSANLERQKLEHLLGAVKRTFGIKPRAYKAGRYGISRASLRLIEEAGFDVDLSVAPTFNYSGEGGPDFSSFSASPYWFGHSRKLLELPTTSGFVGLLRAIGTPLWRLSETTWLEKTRYRGALHKLGLLARVRLSPEAYSAAEMIGLTRVLLAKGCRYFTLSFHSSSLQPGFTPYSNTRADTDRILAELDKYLDFFTNQLHGKMSTPSAIYDAETENLKKERRVERPPG